MAVRGFDAIRGNLLIPSGSGHKSNAISVPLNVALVTIYVPALTSGTWGLEALVPDGALGDPTATETYLVVSYFETTTGTVKTISGLTDNLIIVIPGFVLPGGVIRIATSADQTGAKQCYAWFSQAQR